MAQIRVMLVDDSPVFISVLEMAIARDPQVTVAGKARNGVEALEKVGAIKPDVIVCDIQMPRMSGIEFLQALLPKYTVPVVVISSTPGVTLKALSSGAVDFIPKPRVDEPRVEFLNHVLTTIKSAALSNMGAKLSARPERQAPAPPLAAMRSTAADMVVAIGASTGGTDAIAAVVRSLPANFPGVVMTQHMPSGFTAMYAERLDKESRMKVAEARDGMRLERGQIILAAGDHQMRLLRDAKGYFVSSKKGPKVSGHIPSVDVLFDSVADTAGDKAVGVILTGMGGDGADGLLKMRGKGAYTIGQDQATSVVYGMPMVAFKKGAVAKQLPLSQISAELVRYMNTKR